MPRFLIWPVYAALTAIVLAPVWAMQVPGLGDTLNHLARMHVLTSIDTSPALQRFYEVHWSPIPYLAMDAIVPVMMRVMPVYLAGKLFVMACVLMPVVAVITLHYVVHRRLSLVPAGAFLLSYNLLLSYGFLNYLFSAGLGVMLFAFWLAAARWPRWWRAGTFAPLVLLLYFGHAFACAGYCLAVAGYEIGIAARAGWRPWRGVLADFLAAGAQAVPAAAAGATLNVHSGYVGALKTHYGSLATKFEALVSPLIFLSDVQTGFVLLAMCALAAVMARWMRFAPQIWPAALCVGLAAAVMPNLLFSTWGLDLRFPLFTLMLLLGCLSFRRCPSWLSATALCCVIGLTIVKSADAGAALSWLDQKIADNRTMLAKLPVGARLLVVDSAHTKAALHGLPPNAIWHMPMTAIIDRDAFLPYFFNGLTTVRLQPDMRASSTPNGFPLSPSELWDGLGKTDAGTDRLNDGQGAGGAIYWLGWPAKFDYVLVQLYGGDAVKLPPNLALLAHGQDIDLYRVIHG
jgi:hypothetical protein